MSVDKESHIPLYEQLALDIRAQIDSGKYPAGSKLPSQRELSDEYGVSMVTVRQAISQLESDGILITKQGKGTFVAGDKVCQALGGLRSLSEVLIASGYQPSVSVDSFTMRPAPEYVSRDLQLEPGAMVLEVRRRHLVNEEPLAYAVIYLPESIAATLTREDLQRHPIYTIYEQTLGIRLGTATQRIRAVAATSSIAEALGIPEGTPTLSAQWVTRDSRGVPVEWINIFYRADMYEFVIEVHRNGIGHPPTLTPTSSKLGKREG